MTEIKEFLDKYVNAGLVRILISKARRTATPGKHQVRPGSVKREIQ